MMGALIRRMVKIAPPRWLTFILVFVGVLSSVATDAGGLILVPLAAAAFMSVGRHPLAGLAAAFAGVGAVFGVNLLITPSDSMLTEITNEVLTKAGLPTLEVTANFYFSIVSSFVLAVVVTLVTMRVTQKRLGAYNPDDLVVGDQADEQVDEAAESGDGPADNPQIAMYTSQRVYYVHFPRLYPGDVVELLYRVEDVAQRNAFADYFGEVVYMQSREPIAHAEYVLITPKSRELHFNTPQIPGIVRAESEQGDKRVYRYVAKNVAPLDPEPLEPPLASTAGHVHVSTYKSWDDMGKWYWGLVKDQFVADDEVKRRVTEVTKGLTTPEDKVRAIYDYVVQKTRYVALEFGIHGFKPYRCAQIFARGFGDCKDKATLIVTMLKEAGIPATIVILRTGMRGDFEGAPASLAPFDHAIAYVPSMNLYLDGTAEFTGSRELPAMDRGALALRIHEGKPELVHLPEPPPEESVTSRKVEAVVGQDGSATIDFRADVTGVHASSWRSRVR